MGLEEPLGKKLPLGKEGKRLPIISQLWYCLEIHSDLVALAMSHQKHFF